MVVLQIIDISGRIVLDKGITGELERISTDGIEAGVYICRFIDDDSGNIFQEKLLINN